jgi:4-diphosphocytidyl-2-C-methyl-D-erythritol kinase
MPIAFRTGFFYNIVELYTRIQFYNIFVLYGHIFSAEGVDRMDTLSLRAYGKINLGLDVTGTREDGYHLVRMVMQSVAIYDRVTLTMTEKPGITLENSLRFLPAGPKNLAWRAAELLMQEFHAEKGVHIAIEKHIPVAGGMAGGSSDAAAVLFGVNRLFGLGLTRKALMERGLRLGADVPFCLLRGTVLAEGIGEVLTPLPAVPDSFILIAKPSFSVSTRDVYARLDGIMPPPGTPRAELSRYYAEKLPDIDGLCGAIRRGDYEAMLPCMGNILENVTVPLHPEIAAIRSAMREGGADAAMMSGSGPTVFGLFREKDRAGETAERLRRDRMAAQIYVTRPYRPARRRKQNA